MAKKGSLLRSLLNVSGMTLISRIIGFMRDMLMASYFGAGFATDAFNVAFKLPNLLRRVFAEGAFSQAFVPVLAEYKNHKTHNETQEFIASVISMMALVLIVIVIVCIIFASAVIWITAPGFTANPEKFALTVTLLRITFPYILFISLASLIGGILNTWGLFSIPSFTPTILNVTFIIFIVYLHNKMHPPILILAWAVFCGGLFQFLFQIPFLKKIHISIMPNFDFRNPAVWRVIRLMGPAIFAVSIAQISMVINTIYASFLPGGSISWMYYADRLMEFPTGVLGVALGTILLPSLAKYAKTSKISNEFSQILDWGVRLCILLALPATVGIAIIAKPLTMTLFMHGKFNMFDVIMTERALIAYAIGLMGLILVKVFGPGFYANQDIKTPVKVAILVLCCTQIMNLAFIGPLKHAGLALSIGLGACINAGFLCFLLIKRKIYVPQPGWKLFLIKLVTAVLIMALVTKMCLLFLPFDFMGKTLIRVTSLIAIVLIAILVYFICLFLLGFRFHQFSKIRH
ncbi:MAG: murein biosynthesis integral rane protein MurJ [Pseudomonadota bacterium]|jgi:putative peptidoglycan lipid II flippase|nr:murein biosynthesis integral membrane protein MurJ [Burkholderiales bacterium]